MRAGPLVFTLSLWLVACGDSGSSTATAVIVEFDAEGGVQNDAQSLRIEILGGPEQGPLVTTLERTLMGAELVWPTEVKVTPKDGDATRIFEAVGIVEDAVGTRIGLVRQRYSFIGGQTARVRLLFEDACIAVGATCSNTETCADGTCRDGTVVLRPGDMPAGAGGTGGAGGGGAGGTRGGGFDAGTDSGRPDSGKMDGGGAEAGRMDGGNDAATCDPPNLECDDGCLPSDTNNCGACGKTCTNFDHVTGPVDCEDDACIVPLSSCAPGFSHCTTDVEDGCETPITTATNCGGCGMPCNAPTPLCAGNSPADPGSYDCVASCPVATPTNCGGSCVDTDTNAMHCSDCDKPCADPDNGEPTCNGGVCGVMCNTNFHDCSGSCEPDDSPTACGPSCVTCTAPTGGFATCVSGGCDFDCNPGWTRVGNACMQDECAVNTDCNDSRICTTDVCENDKTCSNNLVANTCLINGVCRTSGELDPTNDCMSCQPATSTSSFKPVMSGAVCSAPSHDIIFPTCDGTGVCGTPYCSAYNCVSVVETGQNVCRVDDSQTTCTAVAGQPACGSLSGCGQDAEYGANTHTYASTSTLDTDNATGLVWQATQEDCDFDSSNGNGCNYDEALAYCGSLSLGGLTNWRIPTIEEWLEVFNPGSSTPASDLPHTSTGAPFWSSTPQASTPGQRWDVSFNVEGTIGVVPEAATLPLTRCVHGAPRTRSTANRFVEEAQGGGLVVYDRSTGLTWVRNPNTTGMDYLAALAYCESLNYAGHTDWRVPDFNELASLFDFTLVADPLSSIPGATTNGYWSSSWEAWSGAARARQITFVNAPYEAANALILYNGMTVPPIPAFSPTSQSLAVRCVYGPT